MHGRLALARSVVFLVSLALVDACSTTRPVTIAGSQPLAGQIKVGDKVEVEKRDGTLLKFKVAEVSAEGLRGRDYFVPTADIGKARVVEGMHPGMVVFLVLLGATAAWMLANPSDVCGDWPAKPCDGDP
jgi:hypothetical protein